MRRALESAAPATRLAAVQAAWAAAVGDQVAAVAQPASERDGAVLVDCDDSVWAQELDLMQDRLLDGLREQLGDDAPASLRFRVKGDAVQ